jgi:amino acid permease
MRRIVLFALLFVVVLCFGLFLGFNWEMHFDLRLGFGSEDVRVSVIAWTLGAFFMGAVCTAIVFATNLLKKGRKVKDHTTRTPPAEVHETNGPDTEELR